MIGRIAVNEGLSDMDVEETTKSLKPIVWRVVQMT